MATRNGDAPEEPFSGANDDKVYVAVGKDVQESKLTLLWAIENFPAHIICVLHVHRPAKVIPLLGGKFPASRLDQLDLREFQELERKIMRKILDDYVLICHQSGARAEKLYIEMDDIGKGIVELVYHHAIKKLVMGAAAERYYSDEMMDLKSRKAKYVMQRVPCSCQSLFICKGYLIHTGEYDSASSSTATLGESSSASLEHNEGSGQSYELWAVQSEDNDHLDTSDILEGSSIDELYYQMEQVMVEAEKSKQDALNESVRRLEAEKNAVKAICRAKALEALYTRELRCRNETEEALQREKRDHQRTKNNWDEERLSAMDQKLLLDIQIEKCDGRIKELEDRVDELRAQLERQEEGTSGMHMHQFLCIFSPSDIQDATNNFDPSSKIGEGGYGSIYKGSLRHTPVAVKVLNPFSTQGSAEFKQEVDVLSKLRHPNLVTLIGACSEVYCALIYEYLPNGSLEDRLSCKDNTPPLTWQARIRIATELCSALIFLHSCTPQSIVHGDLKPGNILLDGKLTCKLSDFGISRALSPNGNPNVTVCHRTDPKGTFQYLDPHFVATGELSPKSDVYSLGIILLQLLTGRPALGISKVVGDAMDDGNLISLLDPLAGDWPYVQAKQLAHLALRCCAVNRSSRPDLVSGVWRVLEPMRTACGSSSSFQSGLPEGQEPPPYFVCPILQEVMQDPHVAADGYTYEAEALRGWLESGHDTSPMTNLRLDHLNLVPNHSLRSAIQEWLEQH